MLRWNIDIDLVLVPCVSTVDIMPKKRGYPAATVEHMIKKYRPSVSQPGSRAASPIHMDKRKKLNQFDIHNIEVCYLGGGGVQPHFCPWKNVCFPIFPHGQKSIWEKKYMERKGKVFISLSFHILFSPWENTHFSMGKNGVGPPLF